MYKPTIKLTPEQSVQQAKANIALEKLSISTTALSLMKKISAGSISSESAINEITLLYKNHS